MYILSKFVGVYSILKKYFYQVHLNSSKNITPITYESLWIYNSKKCYNL